MLLGRLLADDVVVAQREGDLARAEVMDLAHRPPHRAGHQQGRHRDDGRGERLAAGEGLRRNRPGTWRPGGCTGSVDGQNGAGGHRQHPLADGQPWQED